MSQSNSTRDDGGPALPGFEYTEGYGCVKRNAAGDVEHYTPGMSLRDYFAARAMPSLMELEITSVWNAGMGLVRDRDCALQVAQAAYAMADAMIKARSA